MTVRGRDELRRYRDELQSRGRRTNLVGSTGPAELDVHIEDSLAAGPLLARHARVVDLGSGAGFPGLPLAIVRPDVSMTLVEIRERRVHFLRHVVRTLSLDCQVLRHSIDDPAPSLFDVALLRAVAPPIEAVPRAAPWVHAEGEIWIWTTAEPASLPWPLAGSASAARGAVLCIKAAAVSRATHAP